MNEYFCKILIRQRQAEILAAVKAAQRSKSGRAKALRGSVSLRRPGSWLPKRKAAGAFDPPGVAAGRTP